MVHTPLEGSKILPVLLLAATPADFFEGGLKLQSAEEDIIAYATGASLPVPQWLKLAGTAVSQFKRGHLILLPNLIKIPCLADPKCAISEFSDNKTPLVNLDT